jgi:cytochrome c553
MYKYLLFTFSACLLASCTASGPAELHKEPNVELIQDMMESPALKAQDFDTFDRTKPGARVPPDGTVPVGYAKYPYHMQPDLGSKNNKNPYEGHVTVELLDLGRTKFETYCAVCHGYEGKGDGPVSVKMAVKPPSLMSDKIMNTYNDGRIFHVISDGQGVMSSYAYQLVNPNDRWAIVNYVRSLQKLARGSSAAKEKK